MRKLILLVAGGLLIAGCTARNADYLNPEVSPSEIPMATSSSMIQPKVVRLMEQNSSGQSGTAIFEEVDGKTKVTLTMTGKESAVSQPAHIHLGVCPKPGDVKYPLSNVVGMKSETIIEVKMSDFMAMEQMAVNVHKSAAESSVYTSCGDIQ